MSTDCHSVPLLLNTGKPATLDFSALTDRQLGEALTSWGNSEGYDELVSIRTRLHDSRPVGGA